MTRIAETFHRLYEKYVLEHPALVLIVLTVIISLLGYHAMDFRIDASADALLLENDKDLRYARLVGQRYGVNDFLLISYSPADGDLLSEKNLAPLNRLRNELNQLASVESVLTILDVPLLESPPVSYEDIAREIPTLRTPTVDKDLARVEFRESPFYRELLVSEDMKTTALIVNLKADPRYEALIAQKNVFLDKKHIGPLSRDDEAALKKLSEEIRAHQIVRNEIQHTNIEKVRLIIDGYRSHARIFLGGISMISDDMITYIKSDLKFFGTSVFLLLLFMLGIIFRTFPWVLIPMLCCFLAVISMMGVLGASGWDVTVISSNFISLQLIITLAIVIHLVVRYREFQQTLPDADRRTLVKKTVRTKFVPCFYAAMTTVAGFSSLLLCDIKPVIHFGWMMSMGILFSLVLTFLLFPACTQLLKRPIPPKKKRAIRFSLTGSLARFTEFHGKAILVITLFLSVVAVFGIHRLEVENSFIDYFKQSTEIYRGMAVIDRQLGGTTPLDVIVAFEPTDSETDFFEEDGEFADPFDQPDQKSDENKYWFIEDRMELIEKVHDYLEEIQATGKVLSLGTLVKIAKRINDGQPLDSLEMAVLYTKLPEEYKDLILHPYVSFEQNEARFSIRIIDSMKDLKRKELLEKIKRDLVDQLHIDEDKIKLSGLMVLYNNMLQSLYSSQIKTIGLVALVLLTMFIVLFRSIKVALIALFPNLFSAGVVLGVMGWMGIPLDLMTITIAAISIGIAVDDTIHYIYRFREEVKIDGNYKKTLYRCHNSIGHAMYYTSITIVIGFSILVFSNFWPTIYFGLFTSLAMLIALIAALTILPQLLILFKPFGPELSVSR